MTPHPLRAGLAGLVDYAGLFPPASLDLPTALGRFAGFAAGPDQWMVGRVIVPLAQAGALGTFVETLPSPPHPGWTVSALLPAGTDLRTVTRLAGQFNAAYEARGVAIVAVEFAAGDIGDVERFADAVGPWLERYVELPLGDDLDARLAAVARAGCYAKVRTGGVTPDRFPSTEALAAFIRGTIVHDVPFKATAGLHHPLRDRYPLTDESDSPLGRMHGFVNVLVATAAARKDRGIAIDTLCRILDESSPAAFTIGGDSIAWQDVRLSRDELVTARTQSLRSIGSCSFEEPVEDLRALGWWPHDADSR